MKQQKLLKTIVLGLLAMVGVNAWAGDFIDDASSIEIVNNSTTYSTTNENLTINTSSGKKSLVFTPGAAGECQLKFTFSSDNEYSLAAEKAFLVVEMSANLNTSSNGRKIRKLTIGGTDYDCTAQGNWNCHSISSGTRQIAIFSPLSNNSDLNTLYQNASSAMSLTFANVIVPVSSASETTIYSVAMYTLGNLLKTYPDLCTSKDWQYISLSAPRIESNGTGGKTIKIKDTTGGAATEAQYNYFMRTLDLTNLPAAYTNLNFGNLRPSFWKTEDIFTSTQIGTRNILLSHQAMHRLPTVNSKLSDSEGNTSWYRFMDDSDPSSVTAVVTGNGSANWGTYTRELKSGYNTVLIPFKKLAGADYQSADLTFYKVSSYSGGIATFEKVTNTYGSNTFIDDIKENDVVTGYKFNPFIIYTEKPGLYTFVGRDVVAPATYYTGYKEKKFGSTNLYFVGTFENECPTGSGKAYENYTCYGIPTNATTFMKKMNSTTTAGYYRAFIVNKSVSPARELSISFDNGDGTTDIVSLKDVHGLGMIDNGVVYNLQGVRMNGENLPCGIYVKNGKKFIVK